MSRLGNCLLALVLVTATARATVVIPELARPVMDEAKLLNAAEQSALSELLFQMQASGKVQFAIYTLASLQGEDIEGFSIRVAEKWKLGKKKTDNGLLLVIAQKDRRMRFEVGYGLEGDLPDARCRRILDNQVAPLFKQGQFYGGLRSAVFAVADTLKIPLEGERPTPTRQEEGIDFSIVFFILLFLAAVVIVLRGASSPPGLYRNHWWGGGGGGGFGGGGGSGGGFGGFSGGGGGFGGGGSSSSW